MFNQLLFKNPIFKNANSFLNVTPNVVSVPKGAVVARFTILTPKQAKYLQPIDPALLNIDGSNINELVDNSQQSLSFPTDCFCFPTPENCEDPDALSGFHKRIFETLKFLKEQEKLDPTKDSESRKNFLSKFRWDNSILTEQEKEQIEELLVSFHNVFARHNYDVGGNDQFKIKLAPETQRPVYTQSPPIAIHLREEILIDLAIMQYFGIITTLPYSK